MLVTKNYTGTRDYEILPNMNTTIKEFSHLFITMK